MTWMAWTTPTAAFFEAIFAMLVFMLVWELVKPTQLRRGFLPIATTRGDRLFIGLLGAAFVHLAWIGLGPEAGPVWPASGFALVLMAVIGRWG